MNLFKIIFVLCILLFIFGCANPGKYATPQKYMHKIEKSPQIASDEKSIIVTSDKGWQSSGIHLISGDIVEISSSGTWLAGPIGHSWVGAEGQAAWLSYREIPEGNLMSLLVRVGDGYPLAIGSKSIFQIEKNGEIYFRPNDANGVLYDNKGQLNLSIKLFPYNNNQINIANQFSKSINNASSFDEKYSYNSWAVVVGISKYQYAGKNGLSNLIFADDDANAFAQTLRNLGWNESHIKLLTNEEATQRNIMIALESWLSKAKPNDQIILFWAGHGYPDPEDPEKVYFATYDTDIKIPATGYRMDQVRRALEERKTKNVVLLADTCHAGKLITRSNNNRGISIAPNIKQQNIPKGWVFMVGADTDSQAIENSSWANGAFTYSLLKGLNGEADGFQSIGAQDGIVTMGELRAYLSTAMPEETQKALGIAKHPVIATNTGDPTIWNMTIQRTINSNIAE